MAREKKSGEEEAVVGELAESGELLADEADELVLTDEREGEKWTERDSEFESRFTVVFVLVLLLFDPWVACLKLDLSCWS